MARKNNNKIILSVICFVIVVLCFCLPIVQKQIVKHDIQHHIGEMAQISSNMQLLYYPLYKYGQYSVKPLIQFVEESDKYQAKKRALVTLMWIGDDQSVDYICGVAQNQEHPMRADAIVAIGWLVANGRFDEADGLDILMDAIDSNDDRVILNSCFAFSLMPPEKRQPILLPRLQHFDDATLIQAIRSLSGAKGKPTIDVDQLAWLITHDNNDVRKNAVILLHEIGTEEARFLVQKAVDDPDPKVREVASHLNELWVGK